MDPEKTRGQGEQQRTGTTSITARDDSLDGLMRREQRALSRGTLNYGMTYYVSRITLIVASAIVAAGQNLSRSSAAFLVGWVPALSLLVAVLTALDTWLKPQQKWKGFMESRDTLSDLLVQVDNGLPREEARKRFAALRKEHRRQNIF